MLSSGIIDLSVGIIFVFGVTAAIASVATELVARLFGLRGAYLLLGLRELLDSQDTTVSLGDAEGDFEKARTLINTEAKKLQPGATVTRAAPALGPHPAGAVHGGAARPVELVAVQDEQAWSRRARRSRRR